MEQLVNRVATYAMASKFSQALFNDLKIDYGGERSQLMVDGLGTIWTERSERATIRTWAEAAGIPEEVRKQMGRWTPTSDQAYERTGGANVLRAQSKIARFIKARLGREDPFDERAVLHAAADKMREWGFRQRRPWKSRRIRLGSDGTVYEEDSTEPEEDNAAGFEIEEKREGKNEMASDISSDETGSRPAPKEAVPHGTYVLGVIGRSERKTHSIV